MKTINCLSKTSYHPHGIYRLVAIMYANIPLNVVRMMSIIYFKPDIFKYWEQIPGRFNKQKIELLMKDFILSARNSKVCCYHIGKLSFERGADDTNYEL